VSVAREPEAATTGRRTRAAHKGNKWWTLAAMCLALFMIMLDNTVVNVALPTIQRDLHTTPSTLEWTINSYVLTFAALILLGGKLGDRFGRRRIFLVGLAVFTIMSAACALSTSDEMLIAFRALQGVGAALMNPLSLSIIVAAFPRRQVSTAIGMWAGISGLGMAIGPLVGGVLVESISWSAVFWVNVPIGLVAALATLAFVAESREPGTPHLDVVGAGLVTAGLFALVFGLIETNSHSWTSLFTLSWLAAAAVLLALFVAWEARAREPMLPLRFFRSRRFSVASVAVAFVGLGMFGVIYFLTLYFQNVKGYSALEAGLATLPLTGMLMLVAPMTGKLQQRFGNRALMSVGLLLGAGGLLGLTQLTVDTGYMQIWPFYIMIGGGIALALPSTSAMAMGAVETGRAGVASGVINASRQVGAAMGIAILGAVGATLASNSWADTTAGLTGAAAARADTLTAAVIGGQGAVVGQAAGPAAEQAALEAFVSGIRGAMWVAAGLLLAAALVGFFGLRGHPEEPLLDPSVAAAEPERVPVEV
jgi:EmrB/QacA subfamily drug resistance transporter